MKKIIALCTGIIFSVIASSQPTFSKRYVFGAKHAQLIDFAPDGGIYFCCRTYNFNIMIGKADSLGNLEWCKQIGNPQVDNNIIHSDIIVLNNGNVVLSLYSNPVSNVFNTYIISFDESGNLIFTRRFVNATGAGKNIPNNMIVDGDDFFITVHSFD
ncbi:MAG: hypothetical protein JJE25_13190, partial [Bacteroidia bacterium]|nr:hypothetical protein [Bacteroidia bacterium]